MCFPLGAVFVAMVLPVAAGPQEPGEAVTAKERALPVVRELMQTLEGRLREAMGEGGPSAAIRICQQQAMELTAAVQKAQDIAYLKRVGTRVRNPANQPDQAEQRALAHFLAEGGGSPDSFPEDWIDTVELPDGSTQVRYYRAITMQARCLPCHGPEAAMPQQLRSLLDELYPADAARGFKTGELRGLMVVGLNPERQD